MPADMSMCLDHECPSRDTCRRYTSRADPERQAYAAFKRPVTADRCEYYWSVEQKEVKR